MLGGGAHLSPCGKLKPCFPFSSSRRQRERELDMQLNLRTSQLSSLQQLVDNMQKDCEDVSVLRDEVDVLRPTATALAKAEVILLFANYWLF